MKLKVSEKLLVILITINLFFLFVSMNVGADETQGGVRHHKEDQRLVNGRYWSFEVYYEDDELKLKNVYYKDEQVSYNVFREIEITIEDYHERFEFSIPDFKDSIFSVDHVKFDLEIKDTPEGSISIKPTGGHDINIDLELGRYIEVSEYQGETDIYLQMGGDNQVLISWSGKTYFTFHREPDRSTSLSFLLKEQGELSSSISHHVSGPKPAQKVLGRISMDASGELEDMPMVGGLSISKKRATRGDVELNISGDFDESKVVNINIDRELIGSKIEDISEMKVSIDGDELEYMDPAELYDTDEEGYYVNLSKTQTSVYIRMNFSEHNVRIYEDVSEGGPSVFSPVSVLGLMLGVIVVAAGAAVLFKKK